MDDFPNSNALNLDVLSFRIRQLLTAVEAYPDETMRQQVFEIVQTLLDLHRVTLKRVLEVLLEQESGQQIYQQLLTDPLIETVLRGYGLADIDLHAKVSEALHAVRSTLLHQEMKAQVLGIREGVAQIQLYGFNENQHTLPMTLQSELENLILEYVPELAGVEFLFAKDVGKKGNTTFIPLEKLQKDTSPRSKGRIVPVLHLYQFRSQIVQVVSVDETDDVLLYYVDQKVYSCKNLCPAPNGKALHQGLVEGPILTCLCHGYRYDLRDGRCLEQPTWKLEALPVTVEGQTVFVTM